MPGPKFKSGIIKSLQELGGLRQQLVDQKFEALRVAQEAAAARQQATGEAAARASNILNNATGVRTASSGRVHFTKGRKGSGIYVPAGSSGSINTTIEQPQVVAKEIQMPQEVLPITGRIRIKSSRNPLVNVTQSMQNAYDMGLPGLQSAFQSDMAFMHAPLMQRLVDRTGKTAQAISKQINPETGQIYANYFGVVEPNYLQWRRLHEMVGGDRPTAQQAEELFNTRQMHTIFGKMQDLLGIERTPSLYPTKALETAATTVKGGDASGTGMNSILRPFRQQYVAPVVTGIKDQQFKSMTPSQAIGTFEDSSFGELDPTRIQSVVEYRRQYDPNYNVALRSMERALQERYSPDLMADYNRLKQYGATNLEEFEQFEHMLNNAYSTSQIVESIKPRTVSYPFPTSDGNSAIEGYQMVPHPYFNGFGKFKNGGILSAKSGIHIKKENRGKFTKSAKAAGRSVQEHARAVLNNPNATPLQKKRANFARNAAKWHHKGRKHQFGGKIVPNWAYNTLGGE